MHLLAEIFVHDTYVNFYPIPWWVLIAGATALVGVLTIAVIAIVIVTQASGRNR